MKHARRGVIDVLTACDFDLFAGGARAAKAVVQLIEKATSKSKEPEPAASTRAAASGAQPVKSGLCQMLVYSYGTDSGGLRLSARLCVLLLGCGVCFDLVTRQVGTASIMSCVL